MVNLGNGHGPFPPQAFFTVPVPPLAPVMDEENDGGWFVDLQRSVGLAAIACAIAGSALSAQAIGGQFEEMPSAIASPGVQQQLVISPSAKESSRVRHFYASEELPTATATFVYEDGGWVVQLPAPIDAPKAAFTAPEQFWPIMGDEDGWRPTVSATQDTAAALSSVEELPPQAAAAIVEDDGWRVPGPTDSDPLLPAPWIDGGEGMQWAVFDESSYEIPRQILSPAAVQPFSASDEIVAQPPGSINVDDIPRVLSLALAQTLLETPAPAFGDTEERVVPPAILNVDDVPQPVYDRQTFVSPPVPQLFAEAEVEIPPPSIKVDDVPQPVYERQTFVSPPVPQVFTEAELEITPLTVDRAIAQSAGVLNISGDSDTISIYSTQGMTVSINSAE